MLLKGGANVNTKDIHGLVSLQYANPYTTSIILMNHGSLTDFNTKECDFMLHIN